MMSKWVRKLLFPPRCVFCGCILKEEENSLCTVCAAELERLRVPQALPRTAFLDGGVAVAQYDGVVRKAMHRFKYNGKRHAAVVLADQMAERLEKFCNSFDAVTWVPVHLSTFRRRGYDQAGELAKEVAKRLQKPCLPLLRKNRKTKPMYRLTASQRRANVLGAFSVKCRPGELNAIRLLLVDDTVTTGATLSECARMLKTAGADKVLYATFAKTVKRQ